MPLAAANQLYSKTSPGVHFDGCFHLGSRGNVPAALTVRSKAEVLCWFVRLSRPGCRGTSLCVPGFVSELASYHSAINNIWVPVLIMGHDNLGSEYGHRHAFNVRSRDNLRTMTPGESSGQRRCRRIPNIRVLQPVLKTGSRSSPDGTVAAPNAVRRSHLFAAQPRVLTSPLSSKGRYHVPRQWEACLSGVLSPPFLPCDCFEPRPVLTLSSFQANSEFCPSN
ncbi:hypothetical protein FB451DRAFT_1565731 [Mycena latifolia]|nr:hypothetical protein FB451DRAFT_1565731 [Mycena latifolia]